MAVYGPDLASDDLFLRLTLGPPPTDRETWTTDDMFELRQEVRRRVRESGVDHMEVSYEGGASDRDPEEEPVPARSAEQPATDL